tara:strand:- start:327 stop:1061 length:735 start_codon:yes stop_codon:yes gene_type:complete
MGPAQKTELLFLHALPLDGTMWAGQMHLLPGATYAPNLYSLGETVQEWAAAALKLVTGDHLIVVGCSVGGSCAIEFAAMAPERVAALVLIGTKADRQPNPVLHASAVRMLREDGMARAWETYWAPLFSRSADKQILSEAEELALALPIEDVARGVTAFHTRPSRADFLSNFKRPVIVITGVEDIAPGHKISAAQAEAAPLGALRVIPNCGHYVPIEQPDALNAILREVIEATAQNRHPDENRDP